jgi:hypothetical protein
MSHWDFLFSLWGSDTSGNFVDGMKNVCAVIAIPAYVAYPNGDILQDDEPTLVFECLLVYSAGPHCPLQYSHRYPYLFCLVMGDFVHCDDR